VFAIVPAKPLIRSKSRLAGCMTALERQALSESMLVHTLDCLKACASIQGVLVVSPDPEVLTLARRLGAAPVRQWPDGGLNHALHQAGKRAKARGAGGLLVLLADLPKLERADIDSLLAHAGPPPSVVLAPDRHGSGTNALLMAPPGLIEYAFGPLSFLRHRQMAEAAGAHLQVYHAPALALDLDVPEDLALLRDQTAMAAIHPHEVTHG
jgi:2-phospho-L-lactate guanylyltransferase